MCAAVRVDSIALFGRQLNAIARRFASIAPCSNGPQSFKCNDLKIIHASGSQLRPKPEDGEVLKFGHTFSDHMFEVDYCDINGWGKPIISPLHNFAMHPGAKVFHYAIELFEGMKAYRGIDGKIRLFRPDLNMQRMRRSAARSSLPDFDGEELIKIIGELIKIDEGWVPHSESSSLYIRPTMIALDPTLGVAHSTQSKLYVLTGPAGQYYPTGFKPVTLMADPHYIRAFPGGVGQYKMGCNYAPTVMVSKTATQLGCQQVLWLFGEDEHITEVGTMNIMIFWRNENGEEELVTPPLDDGVILPGVTRDSVLAIAREWKEFKVSERNVGMREIRTALKEKRLYEMFGSGTACVVSPVGKILYKNNRKNGDFEELLIPTMEHKPNVMQRIHDTIKNIQYAKVPREDWMRLVV